MDDAGEVYIDDEWVEPDLALKIGPFSCYCVCVPRTAAPAGSKLWKSEKSPRYAAVSGKLPAESDPCEPDADSFIAAAVGSPTAKPGLPTRGPSLPGQVSVASLVAERRTSGLLGPVVWLFEAALVPGDKPDTAAELKREPLIKGLEAYAQVLNQLGDMGSYITNNTEKLRRSKADPKEENYRAWMLSELPVHGPKFSGYVDDSAWMGNLWLAWTLEFFVEMFDNLHKGKETKETVEEAYKRTLATHHSWIQRQGFYTATAQMPARRVMIDKMRDNAEAEDVLREVAAFVKVGRPVVKFLLETNEIVENRMKEEAAKKKSGW